MRKQLFACLLCLAVLFSGCGKQNAQNEGYQNPETQGAAADLGGDDVSFGAALDTKDIYDGYFEEPGIGVTVTCLSGTPNAWRLEGSTLTFTALSEESVYSVSGQLKGNIVIDVGEEQRLELELWGFSLVSDSQCPITVLSGDEVTLTAKKDHSNYLYDQRVAIDAEDTAQYSGAIHSEVDLKIGGKGRLTVVSENNNGIHSKDDLKVKNLTLLVTCVDNALKGNDSVEIEGGELTLIATGGDGIKTSASDLSEKGNQRGTITVTDSRVTIYAACDGIDAAYNAVVEGDGTALNIYTDKYSNYSEEVTSNSEATYYIRFTSNQYAYSVKYSREDGATEWVNATYHSSVQGGRSTYYYYSFPKRTDYDKMQFFIYSSDMQQGQENDYLVASEAMTPNTAYDTFALTARGSQLSYSWTNYTTNIGGFGGGPGGGPGGMGEGNSDKGDHSTKGIKAANEVMINGGTVNIKSYDDAVHANSDVALENGSAPLGNVTVSGGTVTLYSNDDGLHADGTVSVTGGTVSIINSYEGVEGSNVRISGGYVSVTSSDDGINGTATSGNAIAISGGTVYIYCRGDGIDSNSRTSYEGIVFSGGNTVVISNSGGNSAIDTEQGYSYTGGTVVALMPRGGMSNEATHCRDFSSLGSYKQMSLSSGDYLEVSVGQGTVTLRMPVAMSALVVVLGDSAPDIKTVDSVSVTLDRNGVCWN